FQAEDGIRDGHVTGVQTCALPISLIGAPVLNTSTPRRSPSVGPIATARTTLLPRCCWTSSTSLAVPCSTPFSAAPSSACPSPPRSEERRVGKECQTRRSPHRGTEV